jgi:hypothetical protein
MTMTATWSIWIYNNTDTELGLGHGVYFHSRPSYDRASQELVSHQEPLISAHNPDFILPRLVYHPKEVQ